MKFRGWFRQASFDSGGTEKTHAFNVDFEPDDDSIDKQNEAFERETASIFDKFRLLMWKNYLILLRHKIQTIVQILIPILFTANLILVRILVKPEVSTQNTVFNAFNINQIRPPGTNTNGNLFKWSLVYSPKNAIFDDLLKDTAGYLMFDGVYGANNPEEVVKLMTEQEHIAGVVFDHLANITELPRNLVYALRFPSELRTKSNDDKSTAFSWQTNLLYPLLSGGGPREKERHDGGDPFYFADGFLSIQNAIARSYTMLKSNEKNASENHSDPNIKMQRYPYPSYVNDPLLDSGLEDAIGLFVILSFMYPIISTVRFIAIEKEKQLKEVMKIMGMPVWLHWTSWFVRTMIFMVISITLMIAMLKIPMFESSIAVFTHSNWFAIWVFLLAFTVAMTTYCFMFSVLFSKAHTAAAVSGLAWLVSYTPYVFLRINHVQFPVYVQMIASISPNVALAYGFKSITEFERKDEGLQWSNFWSYPISENHFTIATTIGFMLTMSVVFLLIALYVEKVFPGEYGVPEKWNFIFKKKFWCGTNLAYDMDDQSSNNNRIQITDENFEAEPMDSVAGVQVKNLRKIFDNGKVACKGVTFNMFCDQITVLLGHNGAGKSTTIKMLIGMIPPTSGTAIIDGHDIRTDLKKARESIGICPQHNILFDELTVREHIEFYCQLKGLNWNAVQKEVKKYVHLLNLESKIDTPSHALSGGMQRKLSFIIALCADSKVVLCDEPTSGVDPAARRELWDLLQSEKNGRTIILTTHFMDEADVLGDRIAIMADGEVKCCGTPFFLKKLYGDGYHLICDKKVNCDSSEVTEVLRQIIPEIDVIEEDKQKISYILPFEQSEKFSTVFKTLENNLEELKLYRFGVLSTELEEVFLRVGSDNKRASQISTRGVSFDIEASRNELLSGLRLTMNQWYAMFIKRFYCWKNSWLQFLVQVSVLVFFTAISVVFVRIAQNFNDLPNLEISLNTYEETVTLLQTPNPYDPLLNGTLAQYRLMFSEEQYLKDDLDEFNEDIQDHFLGLGKQIRMRKNTRHLVGLSYNNDSFIAWFNNQLFHTAPLSLNLVHNAILRAKCGKDHSIQVSNWPIPFRPESKTFLAMNGQDMGSQLATYIPFAMAFTIALYIMFYIRERASRAKLLQFISGVDGSTFWVTSFLFDYSTYILTCAVFFVTVMAFQEGHWSTFGELEPLFAVLSTFGLSSLAITFVASFLFSNASYGFVTLAITFIFTGTGFFKLMAIMLYPKLKIVDFANDLKWFFLAFPHYALGYSLFNMHQFRVEVEVCNMKCEQMQNMLPSSNTTLINSNSTAVRNSGCDPTECDMNIYSWDEPGIGRALAYMSTVAVVFLVILWIIEYRIISIIGRCFRRSSSRPSRIHVVSNALDSDVINEKNKVNSMSPEEVESNNLVLQNLTKVYGKFIAVKGISVAVKSGECFGLLGANGAGKTSTFKMITADTPISSGDVFVNGLSLKTQLAEVHKKIGYCPQFDALLDSLTGTQTLEIFGLLRGYRRQDIAAMSNRLANSFNFNKHIDRAVGTYSGGNKRKLSTAIAIMSHPDVVYLDEPSSGMDPGAKRNLWNVISNLRNSGTSVILTSHSMEECEALCTRLAIMVHGEFKCLGSAQYLKNQFSKGFLLTIKIRSGANEGQRYPQAQVQISNFINLNFPGSYLKEKYQGLLTFYVPNTSELKWSSMFDLMETAKATHGIEDYTISQTTLEQVFLSFTKTYDDHIASTHF